MLEIRIPGGWNIREIWRTCLKRVHCGSTAASNMGEDSPVQNGCFKILQIPNGEAGQRGGKSKID